MESRSTMVVIRRGTLFWISSVCTVGVLLVAWRYFRRRAHLLMTISDHPSNNATSSTKQSISETLPTESASTTPRDPREVSPGPPTISTKSPGFTNRPVHVGATAAHVSNISTLLSQYRITVVESTTECEQHLSSILQSKRPMVVGLDCEWTNIQKKHGDVSLSSRSGLVDASKCETGDAREGGDAGDDGDIGEGGDAGVRSGTSDTDGHSRNYLPVALLQLAFASGECLLLRLCKMKELGPHLEELLTDKNIMKFGVGIGGDVKRLAAGFGVQTLGCVDLQHIAVRSGVSGNTGLQSLALQLLGVEMDKTFHVRCSDWEVPTLTQRQVDYAAADANIALHILKALVLRKTYKQDRRESATCLTSLERSSLSSLPPKSASTLELSSRNNGTVFGDAGELLEEWISERDVQLCVMSLCQGVVDVMYKQPRRNSLRQNLERSPSDHTSLKRTSAYSVRRTRLYHNCQLLAPDGQLLSTIDKRKVEWYLQRGLGSIECESPLTVRLHFEPAGRPGEDRRYYLKQKENICVVCGTEKNCIRKNVVPHEYRKHFPPTLKEHISHDIVLMCVSCHQLASQHDAILKAQIAMEHGAPVNTSSQKFNKDPKLLHVRNHARALLKNGNSIPAVRKEELRETIRQHYGCLHDEVNEEVLKEAAEMNTKSPNMDYVSHAEMVVARLKREDSVFEFQRRWREHFLKTMKPRYLPELWSVDHNPR